MDAIDLLMLEEKGRLWYPPPPNSVLYLPGFPPVGSTIRDFSGEGNDGAITGATWQRLANGYPVLRFAAGAQIVNCGNDSSLFPAIGAWECWVKGATGSTQVFMSCDAAGANAGDTILSIISNKITFIIYDGGDKDAIANDAIDGTSFYHVVANFGTGGMNLIINGVLQSDTDASTQAPVANQDLCLGTERETPQNTLDGDLILVMVHNARVTEAVALARYNQLKHLFGV